MGYKRGIVMPKVSVNIPCFNAEKFIRKTINSVISQTFTDFEVIIINDGSQDQTEQIINTFSDPRIKYYRQSNYGLAYTRNKAVSLSSGELIAFLDQDDTWLPQKLEKQVKLFESNSLLGLVYSNCYLIYEDGRKVLGTKFFKFQRGSVFKQMLSNYFIVVSTAVVRKDIIDELGGFPNYSIVEEFALFLRLTQRYLIDFVNEPLVEYLYHETNTSKNLDLNLKEVEEIYSYWSKIGNDEIKHICRTSLGKQHYGLARRALFHLRNKRQAQYFLKGSFKYEKKIIYFAFMLFCFFPIWFSQLLRKFLLSTLYK